jgi:hypothetical protein
MSVAYVEPVLGLESQPKIKDPSSVELWRGVYDRILYARVLLGKAISNAYLDDPKMLSFILARYKFVAMMLEGKNNVLEIGCGERFGSRLVHKAVKNLTCTDAVSAAAYGASDWNDLAPLESIWNFVDKPWPQTQDAIYMVDVLEHIYPHECPAFMRNAVGSLGPDGVMIIGTPNHSASQHASSKSREAHVNLQSHLSLNRLGNIYFRNVFMFGMNDEVVHTGYGPMCHYLWMIGVGPSKYLAGGGR